LLQFYRKGRVPTFIKLDVSKLPKLMEAHVELYPHLLLRLTVPTKNNGTVLLSDSIPVI